MSNIIDAFNKSVVLLSENRITEGKKELEKLVLLDNKNIHALNLLALCEYRYCNFEMAKKYIDQSLLIKNNEIALRYKNDIYEAFTSGFVYEYASIIKKVNDNEYKGVINKIEEIKENKPVLIEPYILLSVIYLKDKRLIKARRNISKAYEYDKSNYYINDIYLRLKI